MSVGVGMIGREVTFTLGGAALVGVNSKGITFNNEGLDTTDDQSSGWQEFLAKPGLKSAEFSVSGIVKNLELVRAYFNSSQLFAVVKTYGDGVTTPSTVAFDAFLTSISETGESNGLLTFEASFASSGVVTFTPGT